MIGSPLLPKRWRSSPARSHLIAVWFYAGFHKLLSPGYYSQVVPTLLDGVAGKAGLATSILVGVPLALLEVSLGVLAIVPRTRRIAAIAAVPLHTGILLWLSLLVVSESVWPWNAVSAVAGLDADLASGEPR